MWQYNQTQPNELMHYGKKGMKWGKRGVGIKTYAKEAGKMTVNSLKHPILSNKAQAKSLKARTMKDRARRTMLYQNTKDVKDINKRVSSMLTSKRKVKDIKKQYQKEYMSGENAFGKAYASLTGSHKIYADLMYKMNNK